MSLPPPGPLARSNYLSWPPGAYQPDADPNNPAFNPASVLPASGLPSFGDAALDAEQYHRPIERLHGSGLHGAGVAFGMQIACTVGHPNVTVAPGLALDAAGRHVYLAVGGQAEIGATASVPNTPPNLVPVTAAGAVFPTAGLTGDHYMVAQWRETWDSASYASDPNITQYNDTPWLQLITAANYAPDVHVVLGKVSLDASGNVTAASYGDVGGLQRSGVSVPAQSLELRRAVTTASPGADTAAWGAVGANQANFGNISAPGIFLNGYEATLEVGAAGNYGDVLVRNGSGDLAVSLIGDTGHVVVGGPGLNGEVRMLNANAAETMSLEGSTGSAVVQRLKPFTSSLAIDVDARFFRIHGWDLVLDGRSGASNRALVDYNNLLVVNYAGDYKNGVEINGAGLKVDGVIRDGNNIPLMGNPARKASFAYLFATAGSTQRVTQDVDLGYSTAFTAYCSITMIDSTSDFDYDNAVSVEVYEVDGTPTSNGWVTGAGSKWGSPGADTNAHQPMVTGVGRVITFRLASIGPDVAAAAIGIVFYE